MGFFNEILNLFEEESVDQSFKVVVIGKSGVAIEGYKNIISLKEDEIVLGIKETSSIKIKGVKLYIKKIEKNEVVIAGKLLSFEIIA